MGLVTAVTGIIGGLASTAGAIGAGVSGALGAIAPFIPEAVGTGLGEAVTGGIEGSLLGGAVAGATGGNIVQGLEGGALTGGIGGVVSPALGAITGSTTAGDILGGAGAGAASAAALGGNIGAGALEGGAGGALQAFTTPPSPFSQSSTPATQTPPGVPTGASSPATTSAGGAGGGVASAAGSAAPASLGSAGAPDLNIPANTPLLSGPLNTSIPGDLSLSTGGGSLPGTVGAGAAGGGAQVSGLSPALGADTSVAANTPAPVGSLSTATPGLSTAAPEAAGKSIFGGVGKALSNPGVDLLALSALKGQPKINIPALTTPTSPAASALTGQAGNLNTQGQQLQSYLASGTLPPGMQHTLDTAKAAATAQIKSEYAAHGMSGSSAELADIQNRSEQIQQQGMQMAVQLYQQGVNEVTAASSIEESLLGTEVNQQNQQLNLTLMQDQQLQTGISNLALAMARMSSPVALPAAA